MWIDQPGAVPLDHAAHLHGGADHAPHDAQLALALRETATGQSDDNGVVAAENDVDGDDLQQGHPECGIAEVHDYLTCLN